jgi:MerR family transcriptional regulator, thiopeptide resistance regulator
MSGVTARTLRYYHEIGLLPPARIAGNGYRYYEQPQLLQLQEILLLRELGLDLTRIGQVLAGERDKVEALSRHYERLVAERDRLDRLAQTVAATIESLREGTAMAAEKMFEGFHEMLDELEAQQIERTGEGSPYYDQVRAATSDWDEPDFRQFEQDSAQVEQRLLALLRAGVPCDDGAVFAVLDEDLAVQRRILTLDADNYVKLGEAFVVTPQLRAHFDAQDPRLAEYLRDAMAAYARTRME